MTKILFIHHSTGANLIKEGKLRDHLKFLNPNLELWDHSYNLYKTFPLLLANFTYHTGLVDNDSRLTGKDYNIILSNNSPKEYAEIFSRDKDNPTLKSILDYEIIAFKNCYPTTRIESDKQLEEDINYYNIIRDSLKKYSKNKFILLTPPPARAQTSNLENAKRAMKLVEYLKSKKFLEGVSNIFVFDFFGELADKDGFLKKEYSKTLPWDSHPNRKANENIAPIFAKYLADTIKKA